MNITSKFFLLLIFAFLLLPVAAQDNVITLVTHDSFDVSIDLLQAFEETSGYKVEILRAGDAGQMVNQSILSASNPLGDVLYGVDNTFLSRALKAELFIPYQTPALDDVREDIFTDELFRVTPVNFGDVCLNYDIAYFEDNDLAVPTQLEDLTLPEYKDLLVVENPATSSPGLAFLAATVAYFGEEGDYTYLDFWADLVKNGVLISDGWSDAYFTHFTAASEDGSYPLVVSYASSPPFTVDEETDIASTASIVNEGTCFRQVEYVGILKGTDNEAGAQAWIDFMLTQEFQEDMPFQMYVFPVLEEAELPELFINHAQIAELPAEISPDEIDENREDWIEAWTETVLR